MVLWDKSDFVKYVESFRVKWSGFASETLPGGRVFEMYTTVLLWTF